MLVGKTLIELVVAPVDQAYVPPLSDGVAVNVVETPEQIVALFTDNVGAGLTVIVMVVVLAHCPAVGVNV